MCSKWLCFSRRVERRVFVNLTLSLRALRFNCPVSFTHMPQIKRRLFIVLFTSAYELLTPISELNLNISGLPGEANVPLLKTLFFDSSPVLPPFYYRQLVLIVHILLLQFCSRQFYILPIIV